MSLFCVALATNLLFGGGWTCTDVTPPGWGGAINYPVLGSDLWGGLGSPAKSKPLGFIQRGPEVYLLNQIGFTRTVPIGLDPRNQFIYGVGILADGHDHPLIWSSNGATYTDVLPAGFANGIVGSGDYPFSVGEVWNGTTTYASRAVVWQGTGANSITDITPPGVVGAGAQSIDGINVVGLENLNAQGTKQHALLWHGFNRNPIDLNPPAAVSSYATQIQGNEEVGTYTPAGATSGHPCLWHGVAFSVEDLLPPGFVGGDVNTTSGGWEVGDVFDSSGWTHPAVWQGAASSFQDLTPYLPSGYTVVGPSYGVYTSGGLVIYTNGQATATGKSRVLRFVQGGISSQAQPPPG